MAGSHRRRSPGALVGGGLAAAVIVLAGCAGRTAKVGTPAPKTAAAQAPVSDSRVAPTDSRVASTTGPAVDPHAIATVGALFPDGVASAHTCTAAVVDSPGGNVVLTAAHCLSGTGAGLLFVPGYDDGRAPYGSWRVVRAYAAAGWTRGQNPKLDYAFLLVTPLSTNRTAGSVQSVVGANALSASGPAVGEQVTVAGYRLGRDDQPLICEATVYASEGYPSFHCPGYLVGTSGGPWIADFDAARGAGTIKALIGGLRQGGCTPDTSYSAPFTAAIRKLLARAGAGGPGDDLPDRNADGC